MMTPSPSPSILLTFESEGGARVGDDGVFFPPCRRWREGVGRGGRSGFDESEGGGRLLGSPRILLMMMVW